MADLRRHSLGHRTGHSWWHADVGTDPCTLYLSYWGRTIGSDLRKGFRWLCGSWNPSSDTADQLWVALECYRLLCYPVLWETKTYNNKYWCSVSLFKIVTTRVRTAIMNGVSHRLVWVDEWCFQEWRAPAPHLSECYQDQPTISLVKPHKPEQKQKCYTLIIEKRGASERLKIGLYTEV